MAFKTEEPNTDLFETADREVAREVRTLVDDIYTTVEQLKAAEKAAEEAKARLRDLALARYWNANFRSDNPDHTFDALGFDHNIQINVPNKYIIQDSDGVTAKEKVAQIIAILGEDHRLADRFEQKTTVSFDLTSLDPETFRECLQALIELRDEYGLDEQDAIVDDTFSVAEQFHDERHQLLPAVNNALNKIVPVQVHITT
jgi:hypothetical protein